MILLQISAGRGPLECSWIVWKICLKIIAMAKKQRVFCEIVDSEPDRKKHTFKSIIIAIDGGDECLRQFCSSWIGTIQWTIQSPFRPFHKRKNWFVSVNEIPMLKEDSFSLRDVRIETMRASGAGGQHVNKTESCVRAIHIPTMISVVISNQRSQHRNKSVALAVLLNKINEQKESEKNQLEKKNWQNHNELIRGNPVRKYTE